MTGLRGIAVVLLLARGGDGFDWLIRGFCCCCSTNEGCNVDGGLIEDTEDTEVGLGLSVIGSTLAASFSLGEGGL